jgi:hypothetical protein
VSAGYIDAETSKPWLITTFSTVMPTASARCNNCVCKPRVRLPLISGLKCDIDLLQRVEPQSGDHITGHDNSIGVYFKRFYQFL